MTLEQQIKQARTAVNNQVFGTKEFDAAFDVVRALVKKQNDASPKFEYTSIDGNIFATA